MKHIVLKNGETLTIREADESDAALVIEQVKKVGDETDFLSFGTEDFKIGLEEEKQIIRAHRDADNQLFIIAILNDEIVCVMNVLASPKPRLKHVGEFGLSVSKEHWNKGIGSEMMTYMLDWAKANPVLRKMNLKVNADNTKAIKIYEKLGFVYEGRQSLDFYLNGEYIDGILMGMEV